MPPLTAGVLTGNVRARSGCALFARIRGNDGLLLNRASVASITYTVTDVAAGTTVGSGIINVAAAVFDNLQQSDPRWTRDSADYPGPDGAWGFNFAFTLPGAMLPSAVRYQVDVVVTPVSGEPFRVIWSLVPVGVFA